MKNLIVYYDSPEAKLTELKTELQDIPIPKYGDNEVLIKVIVAASNPKDYKHPQRMNVKVNQGDDVGGIVEAVGRSVRDFKKGDRVAGFHEMDTERGTYAEYSVCPANTVWHIPDSMSFEEAATFPLAAFTAATALYRNLGLPRPFDRSDDAAGLRKTPLIVNGASGAVGAFAVKLAKLNPSVGPVIGIAGSSAEYVKQIGCDVVVDYRSPDVSEQLSRALGGKKAPLVFDASNSEASVKYLLPVLEQPGGRYTHTTFLGSEKKLLDEAGVWHEWVWVGSVHETKLAGGQMFGAVMSRVFAWASAEGRFGGQPYEVIPGGLAGVKDALLKLMDRKGGNAKFVYRVADTPGL